MTAAKKIRVLVTCGATWTPIDQVRVISNTSTGEMGHRIAQAFTKAGTSVTVLEGPVTHALSDRGITIIKYRFFDELAKLLKVELSKKYDIVIHAAAVSDFKVVGPNTGKIKSGKPLTLRLATTLKLIDRIKSLSPNICLVGFKLEPQLKPEHIVKTVTPLLRQSGCDWVVANTLKNGYEGYIVNADGNIVVKARQKQKIAEALVKLLLPLKNIA